MIDFSPESSNPRERRAFAHAAVQSYHDGQATYNEAMAAVASVIDSTKGEASGLVEALGPVVMVGAVFMPELDIAVVECVSRQAWRNSRYYKGRYGEVSDVDPDVVLWREGANTASWGQPIYPFKDGWLPYFPTEGELALKDSHTEVESADRRGRLIPGPDTPVGEVERAPMTLSWGATGHTGEYTVGLPVFTGRGGDEGVISDLVALDLQERFGKNWQVVNRYSRLEIASRPHGHADHRLAADTLQDYFYELSQL